MFEVNQCYSTILMKITQIMRIIYKLIKEKHFILFV